MEITTDVLLRGSAWNHTIDQLSPIFKTRPHYMIYMLAMSVGIMYDKRVSSLDEKEDEPVKSVPRNVLTNNDNGKLDYFFQAAILSTTTEQLTEEERLELAFGDKEKNDFNKIGFLTQFANFGVTKLEEQIGSTPLESMDNLKNFLVASAEGRNLDIDALPDELLLEDR